MRERREKIAGLKGSQSRSYESRYFWRKLSDYSSLKKRGEEEEEKEAFCERRAPFVQVFQGTKICPRKEEKDKETLGIQFHNHPLLAPVTLSNSTTNSSSYLGVEEPQFPFSSRPPHWSAHWTTAAGHRSSAERPIQTLELDDCKVKLSCSKSALGQVSSTSKLRSRYFLVTEQVVAKGEIARSCSSSSSSSFRGKRKEVAGEAEITKKAKQNDTNNGINNNHDHHNNAGIASTSSYLSNLECPKMRHKQEPTGPTESQIQPDEKLALARAKKKNKDLRKKGIPAIYLIVGAIILIACELLTCQRCLHSLVIPCAAASSDSHTHNNTSDISHPTRNSQTFATTTTTAPSIIKQPNSSSIQLPLASTPQPLASGSSTSVSVPEASYVVSISKSKSNSRSTFTSFSSPASSTTSSQEKNVTTGGATGGSSLPTGQINKHNVLCNSRCHCLILEPIPSLNSASAATQTPAALTKLMAPPVEPPGNLSEQQQFLVAFSNDYDEHDDNYEEDEELATLDGSELAPTPASPPTRPFRPALVPAQSMTSGELLERETESSKMATTTITTPDLRHNNSFPSSNLNSNSYLNLTSNSNSKSVPPLETPSASHVNSTNSSSLGASLFPAHPSMATASSSLPSTSRHQKQPATRNRIPLGTGPRESSLSSGPQLYAQSLYSAQAPKLSYHAHSPYLKSVAGELHPDLSTLTGLNSQSQHHHSSGASSPTVQRSFFMPNPVKILQLRPLEFISKNEALSGNASDQLVEFSVRSLLDSIEKLDAQSLSLAKNQLQFELWSELYALLANSFRHRILRLDLSRNSLTKLGITFTGHLEHLLMSHSSNWPVPGKRGVGSLLGSGRLYTRLIQEAANNGTASNSILINSALIQQQQPILIRALDLSHNKIKWLINDQFRALKFIQTIKLNNNRIRYIHQHAFSGLEWLRYLNLNANRLQVIYIEQFQTNYNLLALTIRSNQLSYLRGGTFASMSNLRRLDLSRNKLTLVSNNAFVGLELLELLNCSSNKLVHVPSAALHPLTSLRRLHLDDNLITQLSPGTFFHLPVEELSLERNELLESIERGAFWDLPYLRRLRLNGNQVLSSIDSQAFVATQNLQTIEADSCPSLVAPIRELFDNITIAATARILRHEQQMNKSASVSVAANQVVTSATTSTFIYNPQTPFLAAHNNSNNINNNNESYLHLHPSSNSSFGSLESNSEGLRQQVGSTKATNHHQAASLNPPAQKHLPSISISVKHSIYYLVTVSLLAIALKLVFKYTTTSRYLTSRRQRRKVYQLSPGRRAVEGGGGAEFELTQARGFPLIGELNCLTVIPTDPESLYPSASESSSSQQEDDSSSNLDISGQSAAESIAEFAAQISDEEASGSFDPMIELEQQHQYQQHLVDENGDETEDISVISDGTFAICQLPCCPLDCPVDYGHADCDHFYNNQKYSPSFASAMLDFFLFKAI